MFLLSLADYSYYSFSLLPVCIEGDIRLADSQELVTDSGMEYTSGYPVICVNDQLVPLCNTVEFGLLELAAICYIAENRTC